MRILIISSVSVLLTLTACLGSSGTGPSAPDTHGWIVGDAGSSDLTIIHTTDGYTWQMQGDSLSVPGAELASVSAVDENTAWAAGGLSGGYGVVLRTTDAGETWQRMGSQADLPDAPLCIEALSSDIVWVGGSSNSIYRTMDGGQTWEDLSDPALNGNFWQGVSAISSSEAWFCGGTEHDGRIIHTTDGGATWTTHADSILQGYTLISSAAWDAENIWMVGHGFTIIKTTDGGTNWEIVTPDSMHASGDDANGITLLAEDDAWVVLDYGNIWRTTDGGENWTFQTLPSDLNGYFYLRISAQDSGTAWVTGRSPYGTPEGIVIHTSDGGETWYRLDDGSFPGLWGISFVDDYPN